MKQRYRSKTFKPESYERIHKILEILEDYPNQQLTARQIYYQFVARGWLENTVNNYKNLTGLITDARYAGLVDWDAVEDRGRVPSTPSQWKDVGGLVESALRAYRLPRWDGQENYVELWVEKQALAGVLAPIANRFHVTLMVNKGYSSSSAMKESADRMIEGAFDHTASTPFPKEVVLFYLGDHDPSGEDMMRDVRDRLLEFGVEDLRVQKLALTMEQIRKWNPPPNPAKITDSRARGYIQKYGNQSWELDALPPQELNRIVVEAFAEVVDEEMMAIIVTQEEKDKERLRKAAAQIMKGAK